MSSEQSNVIRKKLEGIKETISDIWKATKSGKKVSKEEKALLDSIENSIKKYEAKLDELLKKSEIGEAGLAELHSLEKKIVQDASATAYADGVVSSDEKSILSSLFDHFEKLNE